MTSLTIRPAQAADETALAEIYLRVRRETFLWVDPGRFHLEDFPLHTRGETITVCEAQGGIVGFLSVWEPEDFIHMLFVLPEHQGKGIGSRLLASLPGWAERRYRLKCLIRNVRAKGFYLAHGFHTVGKGTSAEGEYEDLVHEPGAG